MQRPTESGGNPDDQSVPLSTPVAHDTLEILFKSHGEHLRRTIALRLDPLLSRRIDPSDIVQQTQLEAFRRLQEDRGPAGVSVRVWLRGLALDRVANAHRDHLEAEKRSVQREFVLPDDTSYSLGLQLMASEPSPASQLLQQELSDRVRGSMERLEPLDREIILLRMFENLSNAEVAEVLHLEPGTASKRFGRALLRLGELLQQAGISDSDVR